MKNYFEGTIGILMMAGLVALVGCDKDEASPIRKAELTSGTGKWKLTALTVKAQGQPDEVDVYEDLEACEKDNIFYFKDDGTHQLQAGATKCDVNEPNIIESGTWEINGKNLIMESVGEEPEQWILKLLNATTLRTSLSIDFLGVSATVNASYTKQ